MTTVKTAQQTDIHGKTKYYIIIENKDKKKIINIGENTFNEVNAVIEEKTLEKIGSK